MNNELFKQQQWLLSLLIARTRPPCISSIVCTSSIITLLIKIKSGNNSNDHTKNNKIIVVMTCTWDSFNDKVQQASRISIQLNPCTWKWIVSADLDAIMNSSCSSTCKIVWSSQYWSRRSTLFALLNCVKRWTTRSRTWSQSSARSWHYYFIMTSGQQGSFTWEQCVEKIYAATWLVCWIAPSDNYLVVTGSFVRSLANATVTRLWVTDDK